VVNGKQVVNPLSQGVVTLGVFAPGEYTVSVHYYESKDGKPVDVTVCVVKVNPRAEIVYYGTVNVARKGDEATAARFTLLPDGGVTNINTLPKTIVERI